MEVAAMEVEDDLIFADLSKQISLLIMDDEEDPLADCPSVSLQVNHFPISSTIYAKYRTKSLPIKYTLFNFLTILVVIF